MKTFETFPYIDCPVLIFCLFCAYSMTNDGLSAKLNVSISVFKSMTVSVNNISQLILKQGLANSQDFIGH